MIGFASKKGRLGSFGRLASRVYHLIRCLGLCVAATACSVSQQDIDTGSAAPSAERPNILLIVADDLGFSDIGAFGGEIQTPNLDRLAANGMMLTNMHVAPTCSPTRAMLMTGIDAHRVGLGTMAEVPMKVRHPGYEGHLLHNAATLSERLSDLGYATLMAGKWHLGKAPDQWPASRGFEKSFALLDGGHNHYGLDQTELWDKTVLTGAYVEDNQAAHYPSGEYSSNVFAGKMIDYIRATPADRPLFGYLAFTTPHWPLQAPTEDIARYKGMYDGGPLKLRAARIARMKSLGLIDKSSDAGPQLTNADWQSLSKEERASEARKMEVYAAMVHHMDMAIGKVLNALEAEGRLDNTLIVFMSDNGPDGSSSQGAMQISGISNPADFGIDNDFDKMGSPHSFIAYGPDWAQASAGAFNRFKGYTTEGGTRVPAIVSGPGVGKGKRDAFIHVTDLLPTLLDFAQTRHRPGATRHMALLTPTGQSMLPIWTGAADGRRTGKRAVGTEFSMGGALWKGDWKLLRLPPLSPWVKYGSYDGEWRLHNLLSDPGETQDLSDQYPEIRIDLLKDWSTYVSSSNVRDSWSSSKP